MLLAGATMLVCLAALHAGQSLAGHRTYATFAPLAGAVLVAVGVLVASAPRDWVDRIVASATLLVVLTVPEWLEGEWLAGHQLTQATVNDHAWAMVTAVSIAVVLGGLWRVRETLRVLLDP